MAKQTAASTGKRRPFGFNAKELVSETIVLNAGYYAGNITNCIVNSKEGKSLLTVRKAQKWDKNAPNEKTGKTGAFVDLDYFEITGSIFFGVQFTSELAKQTLGQDEPKVWGGQLDLHFVNEKDPNEDNWFNLDLAKNQTLTNWANALDIDLDAIQSAVDFNYDENIEVPDELAEVPTAVDMLNSLNFYREFFNLVTLAANGKPCKVKVKIELIGGDEHNKRNAIDTGNYRSYCGIEPYEPGCENDATRSVD